MTARDTLDSSELINEAERIYAQGLNSYREHIDASLRAEVLAELEPLERPFAVERLESVLKADVAELTTRYRAVEAEKEELQKQLAAEKARTARLSRKAERMKKYGARVAKRNRRR